MSEDAEDLFAEIGDVPDSGQGALGADDTTGTGEDGEAEVSAFSALKGLVDVSALSKETLGVLSGLSPEQQAAFGSIIAREKSMIQRGADTKYQDAARLRKEAEARVSDAEFGASIRQNPDLMARVMGLNQTAQREEEADVPLADIDFSTPQGEAQLVASLRRKLGLDSIAKTAEDRAREIINSTPELKVARFRQSVAGAFAEFEQDGKVVSPQQREMIGKAWLGAMKKAGKDPLAVGPDELRLSLSALADVAISFSGANPNGTGPKRTLATNTLPPSGGVGSPARSVKPWESEKRKATLDEVWKHGDGGTPDELERALAKMLGR